MYTPTPKLKNSCQLLATHSSEFLGSYLNENTELERAQMHIFQLFSFLLVSCEMDI